ncbi:hypothetical protein FOV72_19725 [Gordonia rubripertincta]|uniref:hypothetical protein n=1 Tax=Gordonia rubripertincta TaxID=36822 RepID=UPI00117CAFF7|nr:hypothetical protein [Gordonia rubripertincta]TSD93492.1 hypothetical protein FOV72_19725 [Gordonia rubripertincta]
MTALSTKDQWDRAQAAVAEHAETLRSAATHRDIRAWAEKHELVDPASQWVKVKTELRKQHDIDYDQLRSDTLARESEALAASAADAPEIVLCVAGDTEVGSFAVCPPDNDRESWYGEYHPKDRIYVDGDELSAEKSAADKAVFLAGKAREALGADSVRLTILTTHPDLAADDLAAAANRARVVLSVEHTETNPAVALTRAPGYRTWREIRLDRLASAPTS